jgi:hypothetical protein
VDVTLEVGAITESISVTAEAAMLETQTASRVGVVTTTQVSELPLNSRNPFMLGAMMSGVNFRGAAIWQRPFDNGAIAEWSVNGGRQSNNEFLMDGAPNNAQMGSNNIAYVPAVDSVQEFSVQQNSYDAQYGKTGGGVFNVVLKSGTNEHHGTAYEFMRRVWMDANTFQNNALGAERPDHRLDQYGFQLDGPVYFPKLLKKDGQGPPVLHGPVRRLLREVAAVPQKLVPRDGDAQRRFQPPARGQRRADHDLTIRSRPVSTPRTTIRSAAVSGQHHSAEPDQSRGPRRHQFMPHAERPDPRASATPTRTC